MNELRADWRVIREICAAVKAHGSSLDGLDRWQYAPLVDVRNIADRLERGELVVDERTVRMPWDNCVLWDTPIPRVGGPPVPFDCETFIGIMKSRRVIDGSGDMYRFGAVRVWPDRIDYGKVAWLCPASGMWATHPAMEMSAADMQYAENTGRWAMDILSVISRCDEYIVEVLPTAPCSAREIKTGIKKPWLRTDVPRVILMNLFQARAHGHGANNGGTHASPRIHERRGHWHTLRHEKFKRNDDGTSRKVWTRPAWVGEREWEYQGNTYRVITGEAEGSP